MKGRNAREYNREHLLRCASDLGSFLLTSLVELALNKRIEREHEYHRDRMFSVAEAARFLGTCQQTIRNRIKDRQLAASRTAEGLYRVKWSDIQKYQEKCNGKCVESEEPV